MDLFKSNAKNKALKDLEMAQMDYNVAGQKAGNYVKGKSGATEKVLSEIKLS